MPGRAFLIRGKGGARKVVTGMIRPGKSRMRRVVNGANRPGMNKGVNMDRSRGRVGGKCDLPAKIRGLSKYD